MIDETGGCFAVDVTPSIHPSALFLEHSPSYLYHRIPGATLGEEVGELLLSAGQDLRLCFNCGSPDHAVASCPEPIDRQLVSLSRQLFHFLHPDSVGQETTRFHVVEGWRQQRLEWLGSYEPGVICGSLLRGALGLQEGDPGNSVEWLRNMAYWGYPPGWVASWDPRQSVRSRILHDDTEAQGAPDPFMIFDGTNDDEEIDLSSGFLIPSPTASSSTTSVDVEPTRWATYPNTYFSSAALSIYNCTPLDKAAPPPSRASATFTPERRALWERILSGSLDMDSPLSVPPWRLPDAFGTETVKDAVRVFVPPPPSTTPPPLPPSPNSRLPTFIPQECPVSSSTPTPSSRFEGTVDVSDDKSTVDMDMSEDSE